jgi:predicted ATPase
MIKQIRVTNIKAIVDSTLIPLQPLTVFIGRNGTGKSSMLEALDWLGRALDGGAQFATEPFRRITDLIHSDGGETPSEMNINLVIDPEDASISDEIIYKVGVGAGEDHETPVIVYEELSVKNRDGYEFWIKTDTGIRFRRVRQSIEEYTQEKTKDRVKVKRKLVEEEKDWVVVSNLDRLALSDMDFAIARAAKYVQDYLVKAVFLRLSPRSIADFSPVKFRPTPRLLDDEGYNLAHLLGQFDADALSILIEKLNYIIKGASGLDSHTPTSPADRRYFTFIEKGISEDRPMQVPAWVLSEGTRRVTALLAVLLAETPPRLLCIEEIENGLDPWTLGFILEELQQAIDRGMQVLLTSHSPYMLNMIAKENIVLCDRRQQIEFFTADRLPALDELQTMLGVGSLYANKALYPDKQNAD